jgi:transitional endoplasmic reticulum ATPase
MTVYIPPPDLEGRIEILKLYTKDLDLDKTVQLADLAKDLNGYTGADLQSLVREATLVHIKSKRKSLVFFSDQNINCFLRAMETVHASISPAMEAQYQGFLNIYGGE